MRLSWKSSLALLLGAVALGWWLPRPGRSSVPEQSPGEEARRPLPNVDHEVSSSDPLAPVTPGVVTSRGPLLGEHSPTTPERTVQPEVPARGEDRFENLAYAALTALETRVGDLLREDEEPGAEEASQEEARERLQELARHLAKQPGDGLRYLALLDALEPTLALDSAWPLRHARDPALTEALLERLREAPEAWQRSVAVAGLAGREGEAPLRALLAAAQVDSSAEVRASATEQLGVFLFDPLRASSQGRVQEALQLRLRDPEMGPRLQALLALSQSPPSAGLREIVQDLAGHDPSPLVAATARKLLERWAE